MPADDLFAFRQPPPLVPPGASPTLAAILLAIDLCQHPDQLAAWWDWPAHRAARWSLSDAEQHQANIARQARATAMQQPPPTGTTAHPVGRAVEHAAVKAHS